MWIENLTISKLNAFIFNIIFICITPTPALAQTHHPFTAKVIGVSDDDSITVLTADKQRIRIRLHGIDCPEGGQAYGQKAKKLTSSLVFDKVVEIKPVTKDRYSRTVAHAFVNGESLSHQIVMAGFGRHYLRYSSDFTLTHLENKARQVRKGLWQGKDPMPPWEWRRLNRKRKSKFK